MTMLPVVLVWFLVVFLFRSLEIVSFIVHMRLSAKKTMATPDLTTHRDLPCSLYHPPSPFLGSVLGSASTHLTLFSRFKPYTFTIFPKLCHVMHPSFSVPS